MDGSIENVSETERQELLADDQRRAVLALLQGRTESIGLAELTSAVVARQSDDGEVDGTAKQQIRLSLHHVHLPKLSDAGVCTYNPAQRLVVADTNAVDHVVE